MSDQPVGDQPVDQNTSSTASTATNTDASANITVGTDQATSFRPITSQDQLERVLGERLARERNKFADYDDLKAKAQRLAELEDANKTAMEKLLERASAAEEKLSALERQARDNALRAAILGEAAKAGRKIADPEATVTFLTGPDQDLLALDDAGNAANVAEAMDALLERRAYLVAQQTGGPRPGTVADQGARGGTAGQLSRDDLKSMSPEQIVAAQKEGRLTHLLSGSS